MRAPEKLNIKDTTPSHIKQIGSNSCGVACLCMITGQSRQKVIAELGFENSPRSLWTTAIDLRKVLNKFNISMSKQIFCNDWEKIRNYAGVAILAVNFSAEKGNFHWIVWNGTDLDMPILDPLADGKRAITKRTKLLSYYLIGK